MAGNDATKGAATRRGFLLASTALAFAGGTALAAPLPVATSRVVARPVAARHVRLRPSIFSQAQDANRAYLVSLSPDRLLHNFHKGAGLPVKAPVYGGWEAQSIAGHTLGHWLTACALQAANTGDPELSQRLAYTVAELARVQAAHGDGYVGATTRWGQDDPAGGKQVFEELRRGDIRSSRFSLNDGWVPVYTWHKVHAGLLDAHELARTPGALEVAVGLAGYFAGVIDGLSDEQVQKILVTEHGGINEAYAQTYALTGDERWLKVARRLRHKAVLDPIAAQRDELAGLHANTQIPKVIGLARLHEVAGDDPGEAAAARFFHQAVTRDHSYVIGGNSDREHFGKPGQIARHMAETTCEACNSYNMLKLTRHLWSWKPDGALFDYYERAQLNHIMAHQRPGDGRFVYFMPMAAGGRRSYSTYEDSFWCCVGSGMESHAKHADSIWWKGGDGALYLNLFIPSSLDLPDGDFAIDLDTTYPAGDAVTLTIVRAPAGEREIALRLPGWCADPQVRVNGRRVGRRDADGYLRIRRRWGAGDRIELSLPMHLRAEPTPDDPNLVAFVSGPLVLAADVGAADRPFDRAAPALRGEGPPAGLLRKLGGDGHTYVGRTVQGEPATFRPFFAQYDNRTAVYVPVFTRARWEAEGQAFLAAEQARVDTVARTVDTVYLGEQQPEVDHGGAAGKGEIIQLNGRSGRKLDAGGGWLEAVLARRPGPLTLQLVYWGADAGQSARVLADGAVIGTFATPSAKRDGFFTVDLPLPAGASPTRIRIEAGDKPAVVYELRVMAGEAAAT
ncbi:glycoside hydrolase family 127 protein [Caulobacter flavus]|uniref:Glycoside hydrolase family 127 protein n=1 Tax=Caulobacter flavus TaxID=1679497 RepID=A0A2N5CS03_9CAUL|nr:beta-L-arabinofuranosidase domain-containing protein [Caulobacter flavus]AYV46447.1 glycoside hydrolase family 127 protein [Caulobacter flavus]PLR12745.1 glycoside hydrolase family 127 protein [Caulobacter flavus]